jgi:hypothetical protein
MAFTVPLKFVIEKAFLVRDCGGFRCDGCLPYPEKLGATLHRYADGTPVQTST